MTTATDSLVDYRVLIARAIRVLYSRGVMHKSGHVAARDAADPNRMWINSRKASRSTLTADDVVCCDIATGELVGGGDEPPSEFHIHRAIFSRRPLGDANAVVQRGHGIAIVGDNVEHVVTRLILAEENARTQYLAETLGEVRALSGEELARVADHTASPKSIRKAFHFEEETGRRKGDLDGV